MCFNISRLLDQVTTKASIIIIIIIIVGVKHRKEGNFLAHESMNIKRTSYKRSENKNINAMEQREEK